MAFDAGKTGGLAPAILNAANEMAVNAFLNDKIKLLDIPAITDAVLSQFINVSNPDLDEILAADKTARLNPHNLIEKFSEK